MRPWRRHQGGNLATAQAPLMKSIVALLALMLPYSVVLLVTWTLLLLGFWALDVPLGLGASYRYPAP